MKKKTVLKVFFSVMTVFLALTCTLASIKTKKIKADGLSDLTNTTWELNSDLGTFPGWHYYEINFTTNDQAMTSFSFDGGDFVGLYYSGNKVYSFNKNPIGWTNIAYRTITITGGNDVTNSNLISWLQNNGVQKSVDIEITHRFWASYLVMNMSDNQIVGDNDISYTVLWNQYTDDYNEQTLTGLAFTGVLTNIDNHSYIISPPNEDILYQGNTNTIDNVLWLEFTTGDYMDPDLYNLMDSRGVWFDDASVYYAGTNLGSVYGFERGRAYGQAEGTQYTSLITSILNGIGNILNIQVFPHITIGLILGLPLLLGVFIIIIKILRG